jgi:hypothetical protein
MNKKLITRTEYMEDSERLHGEYFTQFVTDAMKRDILNFIGKEALLNSTDKHLNDIPLKQWDCLAGFSFRGSEMILKPSVIPYGIDNLLKEAGEDYSCSTGVCILKQAARQIIKDNQL